MALAGRTGQLFAVLSSFENLDKGQKLGHLQKELFLICGGHFCLEITTQRVATEILQPANIPRVHPIAN